MLAIHEEIEKESVRFTQTALSIKGSLFIWLYNKPNRFIYVSG
jgi:hypothetical protein